MPTADVERLRSIKNFPSLVKYLRDDLDWPIDSEDFDELTFDYKPEELGLDPKTAVKVKEIKQLRPLVTGQPWGIFFVNFEPKRLPVVVLRRILRGLVLRKRQSLNKAQQASWNLHDLLFISSYGEAAHRDITFAHFADEDGMGDLPALRVLGWDDEDTVMALDHADKILREKLRWPGDSTPIDTWRAQWSSAFTLRPREVIGTAKALAERMAELATAIRKRVNKVLSIESEQGTLRKLMGAFREALIHDLSEDDFADTYAQTITYGLLTARVSRPAGLVADNVRDMVPITNPFLQDMLSTFLTVGGRKGKIDFDELGINEVVQALRAADMESVMRDFGDKNPQEDPVIHFYELFLKEYDPVKRIKRGVFFTPRPVVSFIVRSVDEILRKEFGLEDGLADTTTWGEMAARSKELKIPHGVKPNEPFVKILDPACGTGTFLVEVIDVIHQTVKMKWRKERRMELEIPKLWNEYVAEHLLPRLYGFELMMAPYAIAHMKLGLKLHETGYNFHSHERARIYLTNTLEEPKDFSDRFEFDAPALAHEAHAVNAVKRTSRFTVVVGNPPYSVVSANMNDWIAGLCEIYKKTVRTRERQIQALSDDYVKFLRYAEWQIERAGIGISGMISNNGYLDGHLFVDMRRSLADTYKCLRIINLHGNLRTGERTPEGHVDQNVFDIQTGVTIGVFGYGPGAAGGANAAYTDVWGTRESKYLQLATLPLQALGPLNLVWPALLLVPVDATVESEWKFALGLLQLFGTGNSAADGQRAYAAGFVSQQDEFAIAFTAQEMKAHVRELLDPGMTESNLRERYRLCTTSQWDFSRARKELRAADVPTLLTKCNYRPFDVRWTVFHRGVVSILRQEVMRHLFGRDNLALLATRGISRQMFAHISVSNRITDRHALDNASESMFVFPLFLYPEASISGLFPRAHHVRRVRESNLSAEASSRFGGAKPEDIFHYIYAILHAPGYRRRFQEFLAKDFPRVPLPSDASLFALLRQPGSDLVALHLLEDDYPLASWNMSKPKSKSPLKHLVTRFAGRGESEISKGYPKYASGNVYVNPMRYFEGVPENVWNFHVGGYQVCEKWLKDRRGRTLSDEDILHYQRVVVALKETIRLMAEIDKVIEAHGGWPAAFVTSK